jgi:hypothetical protein
LLEELAIFTFSDAAGKREGAKETDLADKSSGDVA